MLHHGFNYDRNAKHSCLKGDVVSEKSQAENIDLYIHADAGGHTEREWHEYTGSILAIFLLVFVLYLLGQLY